MSTLGGAAAFPLRHELSRSPLAGQRLAALALLQVRADFSMLGWVASRVFFGRKTVHPIPCAPALLYAVRNASLNNIDAVRKT
jgi:hypothetical protein